MKTRLHIVLVAAALIAIALLGDAWRSARQDNKKLAVTLASQDAAMRQLTAREKERQAQLTAALAAFAEQKRAVRTPQQAAEKIPDVLPPLPFPISIHIPDLSIAPKPNEVPSATIVIPQADLKPLYDGLLDCQASATELNVLRQTLADERTRADSLTSQRDAAVAAAHGGTFWLRLKRSAKWFAIGLAAGATAASVARH